MSEITSLLNRYQLKAEDYSRQISDKDIDVISRSFCTKWRSLPSYLGMKKIVVGDIDRGPGSEDDKRRDFFLKWKHTNGSAATYGALISGLLYIQCKDDAENVCKLIQGKQAANPSTVSAAGT